MTKTVPAVPWYARAEGWSWALLILLFLAVAALVCSTLSSVQFRDQADEGYYLAYASRVALRGPGAFPGLFQAYRDGIEINRNFTSPLRVVTITLGAVAVRLGGSFFTSLALLSLTAFLGLLAVMFFGIRRSFGLRTAWWAVLWMSTAPLHLAMARRALSDTLISAALLTGLWLFYFSLWGPGKGSPRRWAAVALVYAAALLVKESAVLLIPLSLLWLGWHRWRYRVHFSMGPVYAVSLVPLLAAALVVLWAAGGRADWVCQAARMLHSGASSLYGQRYQDGPWFRFIVDLLLVSPWPVLLYLAWVGQLTGTRVRDEKLWFWALVPVFFLLGALFVPYGKNVRFLLFLEMPMRLGAVLFLQRVTGDGERPGWRSALSMGGILLVFMGVDLERFYRFFVVGGIYDPLSCLLLRAEHFLP